jgi:nicotinate-nucleotide pyrophosphorylase (carboxylating)
MSNQNQSATNCAADPLQAPDPASVREDVRRALAEDVGSGDVTANLIPEHAQARAWVTCREPALVCGQAWFDEVFRQLDPGVQVRWLVPEGSQVTPETRVCQLAGTARPILTGERTALNFLQTLSGTATAARQLANLVAGTGCRVLDTRKTIPGLRLAQKYATRCGGMRNHRIGLYDGVLIKENHIFSAGGIDLAVKAARAAGHGLPVEVEVESLEEARQAIVAGADILLLDNFALEELGEAVSLNRELCKNLQRQPALLEASGNVTEKTLPQIAETGVDFVSLGAVTKHLRATDYSMRFEFTEA